MGHFRVLFCAFVVAAVGAIPTASLGATLDLLYESDADRGDGFEFFLRSFATTGDLLTGTGSSGGYSALDLTPDYSVAGMTYDEDGLHVLYESDADRSDGFEFFLRTFASAEDLLSGVGSSGGYSALDLTPDYSVAGMTYDGSMYYLLYESIVDRDDGFEFFLRTFDSLEDLLAGAGSGGGYSALDLTPDYSVSGMTYDEDGFHLLYESDADRSDGFEFFLRTFASAEDLLSGVGSSGGYSELDLTSDYSVSGMAYGPWETTPTIPLPASAWLLFCGVAGFGALRRNRA